MSAVRVIIPALDREPWPTLGPAICDWVEAHCVHGPGDILGDPVVLSDEERFVIYRAYEIYPKGHPNEGRRRFKRVVLSRRKGWAKTELAAFISAAEMDPTSPVRFDHWAEKREETPWGHVYAKGEPVGRAVKSPYIPMVSYTEEQTDDLGYGTLREIIMRGPLANDYDVGYDRIVHRTAPGKLQSLATAPSARDGALTTFEYFDETHHFIGERHQKTHSTMLNNLPKRKDSDPWALETSVMYGPGEGSVAEDSHQYALAIDRGEIDDPRLYFDHLEASELHDLSKPSQLKAAIREASGDAIDYTDIDAIAATYHDPTMDKNNFRRNWLNQRRTTSKRAFTIEALERVIYQRKNDPRERRPELRAERLEVPVVLFFDGSYSRDSTGLMACTVEEAPHIFVVGAWEKPKGVEGKGWRVKGEDVRTAIDEAMETYEVRELAYDPFGWRQESEEWEAAYGDDVVIRFETNQPARMGPACDEFNQALKDAELTLADDERLLRHLKNCVSVNRRGYEVITKEAVDSPNKIDLAVGAVGAFHRACWHHRNVPVLAEVLVAWA